MQNIPRVGIGFIIKKNGKILMNKRKNSHGNGKWGLIGGHLEFMETIEQCVKRESLEEANIKVKNIEFITITEDFYKKENKHYITILIKCDYDSGEIKIMEPDKCSEIGWFDVNNLPEPLMLSTQNSSEIIKNSI